MTTPALPENNLDMEDIPSLSDRELLAAFSHCIPPISAIPASVKPTKILPRYVEYDQAGSVLPRYKETQLGVTDDGASIVVWVDTMDPVKYDSAADSSQPEYPEKSIMTGKPKFKVNHKYLIRKDTNGNIITNVPSMPMSGFEFSEHSMIGNELRLKWSGGVVHRAADKLLKLANGVELTYGQINALGGDFYGTYHPICLGNTPELQHQYFLEAYGCLAKDTKRTPTEVSKILQNREVEMKAIQKARDEGKSTFEAFKNINWGFLGLDDSAALELITLGRPDKGEFASPGYIMLAQMNFDHFGQDARTAYNAGHYCAMQIAAGGDLETAYTMNAFADHFVGDSFASGHIRTPRQKLHGTTAVAMFADLCAMYMHAEDNALGLTVTNPRGETWKAYGDKRLFEPGNKDNYERLLKALQASADEIFDCYQARRILKQNPQEYAVWNHAPILNSVNTNKNHSPLFNQDGYIRKDINRPDVYEHQKISDFKPWALVWAELRDSPVFQKY